MIGKKDEDFANQAILKPNEAEFFKNIDKKAIETKETQTIPCESFTYEDGTTHYFFTTKTPITHQGDPDCVMGISVDITKLKETEKQASENESKFQDIFNKSTIGYSLTKPDGTLTEVNKAFASMLGYTVEELSQMNFADITHPDDMAKSKECINSLLSGTKDIYRLEKRYYQKNGSIVWTDVSTTIMKDNAGNPLFFITSIQDITEKKKVEEELKETLKATTDGIWTWNFKTNTLFFSDRYYQMLGYESQEFEANYENWANLIHPDDKEQAIAVAEEYLKHKPDVYENSFRLRTKKGTYRWIRSKARVVERNANGEAIRMIGTHEDISKKEKIQQQLKHSEERYRNIFERSPIGICIADKKGKITDINQSGASITGHCREELIGKSYKELHFIDKKMILNILKDFPKILQGKSLGPLELNVTDLKGNDHIVEVGISPLRDDGKFIGTQVTMHDVTERSKAVKELQESESRLARSQEIGLIGTWNLDIVNDVLKWTEQNYKIFGVKQGTPMNLAKFLENVHPDDKKYVSEKWNEGMKTGDYDIEHRLLIRGKVVWVREKAEITFDKSGRAIKAIGITQDITDKKKTEKKLKESEQKYRSYIDNAPNGVFIFDEKGKYLEVNDKAVETTGYSKDELLTMNINDTIPDENKELGLQHFQTLLKEGKSFGEAPFVHKNGTVRWWQINSVRLAENRFLGFTQDITDQKKIELELIKAKQRLEDAEKTARIGNVEWYVKEEKGYWSDVIFELYERDPALGVPVYDEIMGFHHPDDAKILEKAVKQAITQGIPYGIDLRTKLPSGKESVYHAIGIPIMDENGGVSSIKGTVQDVTRRIEIEEKLRENEEKFKTLFNSSSDAIFIHSLVDEKIIDVNEETLRRYGYTKKEILDLTVDDLSDTSINSTKSKEIQQLYQKILDGETIQTEWCSKKKNGETFWHLMTLKIVEIEGEKRLLAQAKDIDEMVRSRNKLAESEKKYRGYINNAPNGVFICDEHGRYLDVNNKAIETTGYMKDELLNMNIADLFPKESREQGLHHFQTLLKDGKSVGEAPFIHKDGSIRWWQVNAVRLSEKRFLGFTQDITEKKKYEDEIRESEEKYRRLYEAQVNGFAIFKSIFDTYGEFVSYEFIDINPSYERITGVKREEVIGKDIQEVFPGTEQSWIDAYGSVAVSGESKTFEMYHEPTKKHYFCNVFRPWDDNQRFCVAFNDITIMKQAEAELKRSEEQFRSMFEDAKVLVSVYDYNGKCLLMNKVVASLFGGKPEEYIGKKFMDLHPNEAERYIQRIQHAIDKDDITSYDDKVFFNGKEKFLLSTVYPLKDVSGEIYAAQIISQDITILKKTEQKLRKLNQDLEKKVDERTEEIQCILDQKDEFINQLGHDLKNPLGPLINLLPILEQNEKDSKNQEILKVMRRNVSYMKNLVTRTIQLAQLRSPNCNLHYEKINLKNDVNEIIEINKMFFDENNMIAENKIQNDLFIKVDKIRIHEVLHNILSNAVKYSKDEGGKVVIDQNHDDEGNVVISISDEGIGMKDEQLDMVFNEFYKADTSRHDFNSSGLGMTISKRIIELHGGKIWAESEGLGKGSTFYFTLPKEMDCET